MLNTKLLLSGSDNVMEFGLWKLKVIDIYVMILGVYHPTANNTEMNTHGEFLDQFIKLIGEIWVTNKNLIITGDFNIHANDANNIDVGQFLDSLEALGLKQYVNFPTHNENNTLGLIIGGELCQIKPMYIKKSPYLSDHAVVSSLFTLRKHSLPIKEIKYRKLKAVDPDILINDMDLNSKTGNDLEDLLMKFNSNVTLALDKHVPIKTTKKPWHNSDLRQKLKTARNCERIWRK